MGGDGASQGDTEIVEIRGTIERITFRNEDNLYTVLKLRPTDGSRTGHRRAPVLAVQGRHAQDSGLITAVGHVPIAEPGGSVALEGSWTVDPKFGEQFKIQKAVPLLPATVEGIEKYLGSGMIKGIGGKYASRLVRRFGVDTLDVIENHPRKLRDVPGIGPKRATRIVKAWEAQKAVRDVMIFLHGHGVTPAYALRIYKRYGRDAIATVKKNPYVLAHDVHGIGFAMADRIASKLGIRADAPDRIRAGIIYTLGEAAGDGHCFLPRDELLEKSSAILEVPPDDVARQIEPLRDERHVVVVAREGRQDAIYPRILEHAEAQSAVLLASLVRGQEQMVPVDVDRALPWAEKKLGITFAEAQRDAVRRSLTQKVSVITGGPGTGKTTIVQALTTVIARKSGTVLLAAPTGRAAKRLSEATGQEAKTIHRLLRFSPRDGRFLHDADNPLSCDLLVVDEMSMVDISLMHSLLCAIPASARLVLVGDADQLPSVGPGNVLRDIIRSRAVSSTTLEEIFRQAGGSMIISNAHRLNHGRMPALEPSEGETQDFFLIERDDPEAVLEAVVEVVTRRIPRRWDLHPVDDVQVLTPMHRGIIGAQNLNRELGAQLNREGRAVESIRGGHRIGDKVMQIRNNYDLEVYNGDIGQVVSSDSEEKTLGVRFDERIVQYDFADTDELVPAYAVSIHKSQGSEFPAVVVVVSTSHYIMLQRNLLYTGVTRGKKLVVVVGTKKAMAIAVKNDVVRERHTALHERLTGRL